VPADNAETLRPKLKEAQKALEAALEEACDTDVADADASDLIQLEESLTVARDAARNAISVLRRVTREEQEADESRSETHRIFLDERGVQWDAFPVYPSRATSGKYTLPSPYHEGWLSIQCADEIRRLTPIPPGWQDMSPDELCQLLARAEASPRRHRPRDVAPNGPETRA